MDATRPLSPSSEAPVPKEFNYNDKNDTKTDNENATPVAATPDQHQDDFKPVKDPQKLFQPNNNSDDIDPNNNKNTNKTFESKSEQSDSQSQNKMRPKIYYLLTYCMVYFIGGCILSATTLALPYLQELLSINESQASLIYTVSYTGQVTGSLIGGKVVSQKRWTKTHYYPAFMAMVLCILLFIMQFIKIYSIMLLVWFIIGVWYGNNQPMFVVFIFRVYALKGAIMYSRMLLCLTAAQALFAVIYNANIINFLWYGIIALTISYAVFLFCILSTPQEGDLIEKITEEVLENAEIEVEVKEDASLVSSFILDNKTK